MNHPSNNSNPTPDQIHDLFTYHKPTEETIPKYAAINAVAETFALCVLENAPACADRSHALRCIREARMWANSAIALQSPDID